MGADWLRQSLQEVRELLKQFNPEPEPYSGEWLARRSLRAQESDLTTVLRDLSQEDDSTSKHEGHE